MFAGAFYGSGMHDLARAQCAFEVAHAWDPDVELDAGMATPAVEAVFARVRRDLCASP